jgi:hypothetical protein
MATLEGSVRIHGTDHEDHVPKEPIDHTERISQVLYSGQEVRMYIPPVMWRGECRVEVNLSAQLLGDGVILVAVQANLYEGTEESTDDLDDSKTFVIFVPMYSESHLHPIEYYAQLNNSEFGGEDRAEIHFTLGNIG